MFYRCEFFSRVVRYLKAMTELTSLPCPRFLYSLSLLVRYSAGNVYFSHTGRMLSPPPVESVRPLEPYNWVPGRSSMSC